MSQKSPLKKYIILYSERSEGPQCNHDNVRLVESPLFPTIDLLRKNYMIADGHCTNVSYPGCEDCGGSRIVSFKVEEFSLERATDLGLVDKPCGSIGTDSCRDNYLQRLHV